MCWTRTISFSGDLRLYFQTNAYCRKQHGMEESAQIQRIISGQIAPEQ